jgi:hypothetical protein
MSLNQRQSELTIAEGNYAAAEKKLHEALIKFFHTVSDFHLAERRVLAEMVCKWCYHYPCTCPKDD